MAIIQALLALITRSAGKILNAIFGWAVHALFGNTTPKDQTFLSALVAAAVAWPLLAVGVAAPKVAAMTLAFVPIPHSVPSWIIRTVWLALALLVPLALGVAIASRGRSNVKRDPWPLRLLRGFPLTLGLALAFLIMFVSVPIMRAVALVRREKSADVPLSTDARAYHDVASLVVEVLNRHGFKLASAEPGWWVKAPMRILRFFGGSAFGAFVPERLEHYEDGSLFVSFYMSGVLLRGRAQKVTWAHGLIEEAVVHSDGLQTSAPEAQALERKVRELWRAHDADPSTSRESGRLSSGLNELSRGLATLDVAYDQWQTIYRQVLQLARAAHGEPQLLDATMGHAHAEANMEPSRTQKPVDARSTPALVKAALTDVTELARTQVDLARAEIRADVKREIAAAKGMAIGGVAGLVAANLLLVTAILALAQVMPAWAAGLAVAGAVLVVAAVALAIGWRKRVRTPLDHTRHELKEDVQWAKEKVT